MKLLLSVVVAIAFPWWSVAAPALPCQVSLTALHADVPRHAHSVTVTLERGVVVLEGIPSRHRYLFTTTPGRYQFRLIKGDWRLLISHVPARGELAFQPCHSAQRVGDRAAVERLDVRVHP